MGLDMYLYAEKHIRPYEYVESGNSMERVDNPSWAEANVAVGMGNLPSAEYGSIVIQKTVGYWRKANAVHGWIVRNMANGRDECQRIDLDRDDLKLLRDRCVKALANRNEATPDGNVTRHIKSDGNDDEKVVASISKAIMDEAMRAKSVSVLDDPLDVVPVEGFFFGSTDKDEWYYNSLEYTVELINSLLAGTMNEDNYYFYYEASW